MHHQLLLQQDKGRERTSHDTKLSGQTEQHPLRDTASWVSIRIKTLYLQSSLFISAEPYEPCARLSHCCVSLMSSLLSSPRALAAAYPDSNQVVSVSSFETMISVEIIILDS